MKKPHPIIVPESLKILNCSSFKFNLFKHLLASCLFLLFILDLNYASQIDDDLNYIAKAEDYDQNSFWGRMLRFKFVHAFVASISIIIVSELGDKTFFIAAILAMKQNRWTVFLGAISALISMTILSSVLGFAVNVIPKSYTHHLSILLLFVFGVIMIRDGFKMTEEESKEEFEETEKSLAKKDTIHNPYEILESSQDPETGILPSIKQASFGTKVKRKCMQFVSLVFIETFTMTFLAEWGDRSQISTVILAAREDVIGVTLGACIGHSICTGIAVLGGRMIATMISVKTVTLIGGVLFVFFSIFFFLMGVN